MQGRLSRLVTKKRLIAAGASLLSAVLIAGLIWLYSAERVATAPLRTSEAFLSNMLNKRIDPAYDLTSDIFREETNKEQFAAVADSASKGLKADTLKALPGQGEIVDTDKGKLATIRYHIQGNDGTYEMTVRLLKEKDKDWLIVGVENTKI